jgi:transposase
LLIDLQINDSLPDDIETLKALVIAAQAARLETKAKARNREAEARARELLIEQMKFTIKSSGRAVRMVA